MRRRTFVALTALAVLAALTGAVGLVVRTMTPPSVQSVRWNMPDEAFGGWSGIDVSDDGRGFVAVGDRGSILNGTLLREGGRLTAVEATPPNWLMGDLGPWTHLYAEDAEGVSIDAVGALVISYEGIPRVWRHVPPGLPQRIPQHRAFQQMHPNGSLEAVATLTDGTILTIPELPETRDAYPVFVNDGFGWDQPYSLRRDGFWRAVGADIGPDGQLYLLERQFVGFGFISQIRRFDLGPGGGVLAGDVLYRSPPGRHGNLEGIGIWRDNDGHIRAVMVSDDNFLPFQRSEIVEVVIVP